MKLWFVYEVPQHFGFDPQRRTWRLLKTFEREDYAREYADWREEMVRKRTGSRCYMHVECA